MLQASRGVHEDVAVRVHQEDAGAGRQPSVLEEVATARSDVQVLAPQVPRVVLHQAASGAPPHQRAVDGEHQEVIDPEEP